MKRRFKFGIIGALMFLASLFTLAGCQLNKTLGDIKEEYGVNASVVYYGNGGYFNDKTEKTQVELWLNAEEVFPYNVPSDNEELNEESNHKPSSKGTIKVTRSGYVFKGWYYAVKDETTGELLKDDKGFYVLGDAVDFSKKINVGDQVAVVARWAKREMVEIRLVAEAPFEATVDKIEDGKVVKDESNMPVRETKQLKTGDVIALKDYSTIDKSVTLTYTTLPTEGEVNATFFAYYSDEACTQMLSGSALKLFALNNEQNQVVYAKYITGDWEIIRVESDYSKLFEKKKAEGNYWLMLDLDLTGKKIAPLTSFAGNLVGNGHTIKGLTVNAAAGSVRENSTISIFGEIKSTAKISNLTIEDWSLTVDSNPSIVKNLTTYMFFSKVEDGATFENVSIKGGSMSVTKGKECNLSNIYGTWNLYVEGDDGYDAADPTKGYWTWEDDNYLFGGASTDAEFLAKYSGLTLVDGAKPALNITNK